MADSKPAEKSGGDGRIKLVSWNVNGLRATLKKDPSFTDVMAALDADVFAVQETKLQAGQVELDTPGYHQTWSYAERKGYSGTAVFSRWEPLQVVRTIGCEAADDEGRVCALEFDDFWFVDVYTPNAKQGLLRIDERMAWDERYRAFLQELDQDKPVITCGDFNVAHNEIDLNLLDAGFTDTFRALNPTLEGAYSWWSYRFNARKNNAGWRIDYFLVSDRIADKVVDATIHADVFGSDHCPVGLEIEL